MGGLYAIDDGKRLIASRTGKITNPETRRLKLITGGSRHILSSCTTSVALHISVGVASGVVRTRRVELRDHSYDTLQVAYNRNKRPSSDICYL